MYRPRDYDVRHVDDADGHRYFIITEERYGDDRCTRPSANRYFNYRCRCSGCRYAAWKYRNKKGVRFSEYVRGPYRKRKNGRPEES